jgi:hypothetical protein
MYQVCARPSVSRDGAGTGPAVHSFGGFGVGEAAAGMAQVDVVQGRAGDGDGGHRVAGLVQGGEDGRNGGGAVVRAGADAPSVHGDLSDAGQAAQRRVDGESVRGGGLAQFDVDGIAVQFALERVGGALDHDPALVDDGEARGQPVGLLQVVRGEQDGQALLTGEPADLLPHGGAGLRVETGGRLVQEQHLRAVDQADGHVQPALHAPGVGLDLALRGVRQVEAVEQLVGAPVQLRAAHAVEAALEQQVLPAGGHRVGAGALGDHADGAAHRRRIGGDVEPGDGGAAAVGGGQRGEDLDGGGLARAVGAEQPEDDAGLDGDAEAVERADSLGASLDLVGLDQVAGLDGGPGGWVGRRGGRRAQRASAAGAGHGDAVPSVVDRLNPIHASGFGLRWSCMFLVTPRTLFAQAGGEVPGPVRC